MYCPNCGNQVPDEMKFCQYCGTDLQKQSATNYSNYNETPVPVANYSQPEFNNKVSNRSIPLYLILSIVTCGLFGLYWYVVLVDDLNYASGHPEETSGIMVLILTVITCGIYGLFWYYKAGQKVCEIQERTIGRGDNNAAILYLVLAIFGLGIINYCIIQSELNKVSL